MWAYILVFIASFLVDAIPFVGPPAWIVMVALQMYFKLDVWWVIVIGVIGSALGRYFYSANIKKISPSLTCFYAFAKQAFIVTVFSKILVLVRHSSVCFSVY